MKWSRLEAHGGERTAAGRRVAGGLDDGDVDVGDAASDRAMREGLEGDGFEDECMSL